MTGTIEAVTQCERHNFEPEEIFVNQWMVCEDAELSVPGMARLGLDHWSVHLGAKVERVEMRDSKDRLFGLFIGIGVDPEGSFITGESFTRFNSKGRSFLEEFEQFIAYTGGRYTVILDAGRTQRVYFDPVAHMTTFYNPKTRRVGSSVFHVIDREVAFDPMFLSEEIATARIPEDREGNFILGHSLDQDAKFALPNHFLDLDSFAPVRIWPLPDSFPEASEDEYDAIIAEMVERQKVILTALVENRPAVLPVSGGTDSRKLLACLTGAGIADKVSEYFCFEHTKYAYLDAVTGEYLAKLLGLPFRRYHPNEAWQKFGNRPVQKRERVRKFWLRTSRVAKPTPPIKTNLAEMQPEGHLHLRGNVMDLTRSIWWRSFANRHEKLDLGLENEIGALFLMAEPPKEIVEKWAPEYEAWKNGLPENARAIVYDFIFLELFLHVSSTKYYAFPENFYINPFSDRKLIELTLRLPVDYRFGREVNESFIAKADPRLAGQPYRGGLKVLIANGEFTPSETRILEAG